MSYLFKRPSKDLIFIHCNNVYLVHFHDSLWKAVHSVISWCAAEWWQNSLFCGRAGTVAALLIVVLCDWSDCWVATYFRTGVRPLSRVSVFGELRNSTAVSFSLQVRAKTRTEDLRLWCCQGSLMIWNIFVLFLCYMGGLHRPEGATGIHIQEVLLRWWLFFAFVFQSIFNKILRNDWLKYCTNRDRGLPLFWHFNHKCHIWIHPSIRLLALLTYFLCNLTSLSDVWATRSVISYIPPATCLLTCLIWQSFVPHALPDAARQRSVCPAGIKPATFCLASERVNHIAKISRV